MTTVRKMSVQTLRNIINEEKAKLGAVRDVKKQKAREYEPDELADVNEKHIDFHKALKIKEAKLLKSLKTVRESLKTTAKKIEESKKGK